MKIQKFPRKLLFIVNVDWFFISHRLPIALEALKKNYEVHIITGLTDKFYELTSYGLIVHPIKIGRSSLNPLSIFFILWQIVRVLKRVNPQIVHAITIRAVILGGIASRVTKVHAFIAAVPGLGFVFSGTTIKSKFIRIIIIKLYRISLKIKNLKVIFQNQEDLHTFVNFTNISPTETALIPGSGVDLNQFSYKPLPSGEPVVTMASRLLRDKGVFEFVEAAKILKNRGFNARFLLVGEPDLGNPTSISYSQLYLWKKEKYVEILGFQKDIYKIFRGTHIVTLPSYREGLPKVLIEAAACGRAILTTDVPGCRDAIEPGITGLLVEPKNANDLANSIEYLLLNPGIIKNMGKKGRILAEKKFSIENVIFKHFEIYQEMENRQ